MYYYKIKGENRTRFVLDAAVEDPKINLASVERWSHKDDISGAIDAFWPPDKKYEESK